MLSNIKQTKYLVAVMLFAIAVTAPEMVFAQREQPSKAVPVDRITVKFLYDGHQGGVYEVIGRKQITKVLPPANELPSTGSGVSGFYYELQSAEGTVLYRRIMHNPIPIAVEVPEKPFDATASSQEGVKLERKQTIPPERIFTVLIPRASAGDQLVFFSSPLKSSKAAELMVSGESSDAAQEVARIALIPSTIQ